MSANLIVDLGNTAAMQLSVGLGGAGSGLVYAASGAVIGQGVDLRNADTFCNLFAAGNGIFGSGQLRIQIQTSDSDVSGNYTDPTSGLAALPTSFSSGGILILNSGALGGGLLGAFTSGQSIQSGFAVAAGFQRPQAGTYVRANVLSGDFFAGTLTVGFISQYRTTGSGGGFTYSPGSGSVNV